MTKKKMPRRNPSCRTCLWHGDACSGVLETGADTTGHMHCHVRKLPSERANERKKTSIRLKVAKFDLEKAERRVKMLAAHLEKLSS